MNHNTIAQRGLASIAYTSLLSLLSYVKCSFVVGSWHMFFSAMNCAAPLAGTFLGVSGSGMVYVLKTVLRVCTVGIAGASFFHGIPTLCASLYLGTTHWSVRIALPMVCMLLFWLHPVGFAAGAYALYWLIPVAVFYTNSHNMFLNALGSTFIAHAVGSVIWLYTVPMASATWLALIPVVAIERLCFATGMVVVHTVLQGAIQYVSRLADYTRARLQA